MSIKHYLLFLEVNHLPLRVVGCTVNAFTLFWGVVLFTGEPTRTVDALALPIRFAWESEKPTVGVNTQRNE